MSKFNDFKIYLQNLDLEELKITAQKMREMDLALEYFGLFILEKDFSKNKIRFLKKKLNSLQIFENNKFTNKKIYNFCKIFKSQTKQKGGVIGELSKVKSPGLFYENPSAVPFTRIIDQISLVMDILSVIPYYGTMIALSNFMLSFIRGEYQDSLFALVEAVPPLGPYIGVPFKYLFKYFQNKKPDYRKYYESLISLRQVTKELQAFDYRNLDLDNPMNDTFEYEKYDP